MQTVPMGGLESIVPWSVIVLMVELVTDFLVLAELVFFVKEDLEVKTAKVSLTDHVLPVFPDIQK